MKGTGTGARAGLAATLIFLGVGCATGQGPRESTLYRMPTLSDALEPHLADPSSAAQLAEGALHLLDPARPGGPDYGASARMCLRTAEAADIRVERELRDACLRLAARSALRSGDRELYVEVVDCWEAKARSHERESGELAVHRAIRDQLQGSRRGASARLPRAVAVLLPPPEESER